MAITAEVEVLCQQLKGRGMYTIPPTSLITSGPKTGSNVHFQPIDPAQKSSVQTMDQSLLNSSLNLLDDSPRSQSSSSNGQIPCGQATPPGSAHKGSYRVPPMPYINQTAVDQHMGTQHALIPPRMSTGPMNLQSPKQVPSSRLPDSVQPQRLPFIDVPPAPAKNYPADSTNSPSTHETRSKSSNKQGVKQSSSGSSLASTSTGKSGPICWNCGEVGHHRRNCQNPSYCSKCKQKGHLPMKCPLKGKRNEKSQIPQKVQQTSVDLRFSSIRNKCIHCGGDHAPGSCPTKMHPQVTPNATGYQTYNDSAVADISAALTLMTNAVLQGNSNTTAITNALERTMTQFANALQQTIQMGVDVQAQENKNARMDKQFEKVKVFDGSKPSECHPWLEEVHALCIQTGRPFREMLLLCAGQAVRDFMTDMSLEATDDQIKNDLITGYSDLQGLGCKQSAYDSIMQQPDEPLRSYSIRYSRLFKLLNGTAPDDVKMRTTSMHFVNSLCNYLSSKVENRVLGMNEKNYSVGDTFKVALECELKAIASER